MNDLILAAKAFSEPTRIRIIALLRSHELCVCELCDALEISQSTLSTHLQMIRQAGFVSTRKEGKWIYYRLVEEAYAVTDELFRSYFDTLSVDQRLNRDKSRIASRIQIRNGGKCNLGFDQLN